MKLTFRYEGNTPSKKNQKRILTGKGGKPFIASSSEHQRWHKGAAWEMKLQRSRFPSVVFPIARCARVLITLFYEDRRRRDSSNTVESIMDLLVDAEILADDSWAIVGDMGIFPRLRPGQPGWEATLIITDMAPGPATLHQYHQEPKA